MDRVAAVLGDLDRNVIQTAASLAFGNHEHARTGEFGDMEQIGGVYAGWNGRGDGVAVEHRKQHHLPFDAVRQCHQYDVTRPNAGVNEFARVIVGGTQ